MAPALQASPDLTWTVAIALSQPPYSSALAHHHSYQGGISKEQIWLQAFLSRIFCYRVNSQLQQLAGNALHHSALTASLPPMSCAQGTR